MNYKDTLCLPETRFPMRAQLPQREPGWLAAWAGADLYGELMRRQAGRPEFHLHDGPPFANGDAHMGHALNMTLKDLVLKSRNMAGFHAPFVPGWDCHGLPIEHKVMKEAGGGGPAPGAVEIRRRCAEMARHYIGVQRGQFQRLAVFGEWEKPYITMEGSYEADVLRVFAAMVEKGMVFQALKPVSWSTGCQTALAEAEVEYAERTDLSVVARFALADGELARRLGRELPGPASLLIWTTTPWTLPANLAVAAGRTVEYAVYADPRGGCVVCAVALAAKLPGLEAAAPLAGPLKGAELEGLEYRHPFIGRSGKVYLGDFVTTEAGTGLVHIAPGHGQDDYQLGQQAGLQVLSPVDDRGRLTAECAVPALEGMYVFDANPKVRDLLRETGSLWSEESYVHDYPHCWRSKTPIVFRAVTQWFIRVDEFRARALEEIGNVEWIPSWGENRIRGAVETRPDWCISRQRTWGVPIPAFVDGEGRAQLRAEVVRKFADVVEKEGTDVWFATADGELCRRLGLPGDWKKIHDTLDVWIDSGSSHEAVARRRLRFPADLYLEGSDQHRGWFQSSLLTSVAVNGCAPFRQVLTNGFVVDLDGKKLSKSNTYQKPTDLMSFVGQYGADILRLWVAHEDYRNDVPFSEEIFKRVADTYRTLRNTLRILLANVRDFDPAAHRVADADLTGLDCYVMRRLQELVRRCREAYLAYEFHQVYHAVNRFCAVDLSALYIDVTKDRMYCDPAGGPRRRAVQTVMHEALETLVLLLAPILPFTAEEAWQYARDGKDGDAEGKLLRDSVHVQLFPGPREIAVEAAFEERWQRLLALRGEVNEVLEGLRKEKTIGKSLEAEVVLPAARAEGQTAELLAELFIVSSVRLDPDASGIAAGRAGGGKCVRCWRQVTDRGADPAHPELCGRCAEAVATGATA